MKISERERKMLIVLAVVLVIFIVFYLLVPKMNEISRLKTDIKSTTNTINNLEKKQEALNSNLGLLQEDLNKYVGEQQESLNKINSLNFYKTITDGEKIVEINSFIPVSDTDKFVIEELVFVTDEELANVDATGEKVVGDGTVTQVTPQTETTDNTESDTSTEQNAETGTVNGDQNANSQETSKDVSTGNAPLTANNVSSMLEENGFEQNFTKLTFSGYYSSLVKFCENVDNNEEYVVVVAINISNIGITDPTRGSNIIQGELILAFPTYTGSNVNNNINNKLDNQYVNSTNDPFNPYNGFSIQEEVTNLGENGSGVGAEEEVFKVIEGFNKNSYFFVTNDNRNGGYVSTTGQSTDGNPSLKLYYDFYNRNNKNIAYAVSEKENIILENTPEQILLDVFNDSSNENEFGIVFRDATGVESQSVVFSSLDFNGWSTTAIPLPDNMVYPIVIQRYYVKSSGSGVKQEGTVLVDNLRIVEYK